MLRSVKALGFLVGMGFVANGIANLYWVVYVTDVIGLSKVDWDLILVVEFLFKLVLTIPCGVIGDKYGRTRTVFIAVRSSLPLLIIAKSFLHVLLFRFSTIFGEYWLTCGLRRSEVPGSGLTRSQ